MKKTKPVSKTTLLLTCILVSAYVYSLCVQADNWSRFLHDNSNTGLSTSDAPISNQTWWTSDELVGSISQASPAIVGKTLYISTSNQSDRTVYAFNISESPCQQLWKKTITGECSSSKAGSGSPTVAYGRVFIRTRGSTYSWLHALNASTGDKLWNFSMPKGHQYETNPPCVRSWPSYKRVYACSSGIVFCVNALNGDEVWNFTTQGVLVTGVIEHNWGIYATAWLAGGDTAVYKLSPSMGYEYWNTTIDKAMFGMPAAYGDSVYVQCDGELHALFCQNGSERWVRSTYYFGGSNTPAAAGEYGIIVTTNAEGIQPPLRSGWVTATNMTDGSEVWSYQTGGEPPKILSSPGVADGIVFVSAKGDKTIYAFHAVQGTILWTYKANSEYLSSPAVADDKLFIGCYMKVYAFAHEPATHDIAVTEVKPLWGKSVVCQGYTMNITAIVENQGDYTESFTLRVYANGTEVATEALNVDSDYPRMVRGKAAQWNAAGFERGIYHIKGNATVSGEDDLTDNEDIDGWVYVSHPGDITGPEGVPDDKVNMRDLGKIGRAMYSSPGDSNWDPDADINNDGQVNMVDMGIASRQFGWEG